MQNRSYRSIRTRFGGIRLTYGTSRGRAAGEGRAGALIRKIRALSDWRNRHWSLKSSLFVHRRTGVASTLAGAILDSTEGVRPQGGGKG